MTWISVEESLPEKYGRYLVMTKCQTGMHKALAFNWQYPCCKVNIAYFIHDKSWQYWQHEPVSDPISITYWMPLPEVPS